MTEKINYQILVAPLDWGLGHATRCIPLITHLLQVGCKVIIAAEGAQEKLLKTEFPNLIFVHLPGYRIKYPKNKRFFSLKIIIQLPKIAAAKILEKRWLNRFAASTHIDAVISDNRYGFYSSKIPSVFITHQLRIQVHNVFLENILQKLNYRLIERFNVCWVPDEKGKPNFAGALSHPQALPQIPVLYLGGLSRLEPNLRVPQKYSLLVIVSGPEPQRTILEEKILQELRSYKGHVLLLRGLPSGQETLPARQNWTIKNHLSAKELQEAFCCSDFIISRSGYTTVMDICKLGKRAVLIPTPGQTEQEYLARHLEQQGRCASLQQDQFSLEQLLYKMQNFEYTLPQINMEKYKTVLDEFVEKLGASSFL